MAVSTSRWLATRAEDRTSLPSSSSSSGRITERRRRRPAIATPGRAAEPHPTAVRQLLSYRRERLDAAIRPEPRHGLTAQREFVTHLAEAQAALAASPPRARRFGPARNPGLVVSAVRGARGRPRVRRRRGREQALSEDPSLGSQREGARSKALRAPLRRIDRAGWRRADTERTDELQRRTSA